jgi:hypothetical protein
MQRCITYLMHEVPLFNTFLFTYSTILLRFVGGSWGLKPGTVAAMLRSPLACFISLLAVDCYYSDSWACTTYNSFSMCGGWHFRSVPRCPAMESMNTTVMYRGVLKITTVLNFKNNLCGLGTEWE